MTIEAGAASNRVGSAGYKNCQTANATIPIKSASSRKKIRKIASRLSSPTRLI